MIMKVPITETNGKKAPIIENLNRFLCNINIDPVKANAEETIPRIPKIKNPNQNSEGIEPYISGNTWWLYIPVDPMPAMKAAEIIVKMTGASTKSVRFCCVPLSFC